MSDQLSLSPKEAAHIAANVYFTLEGWEATYKFKSIHGDKAKGAPAPRAGMASTDIIKNNVTGTGPLSLANTDLKNGQVVNSFIGSSGSNLFGRTKSGFGYILQFDRGEKKHLVIAVRGTRPEMGYPDLLTDVNASFNRNMAGVGPVHAGFYDVYKSIRSNLNAIKSAIDEADVVHCVGHSLGGAVANLVALHVAQTGANTRLYTFGAPRVGLRASSYDKFVDGYIGGENVYRVSHNFDPIPMIPVAPYIHALPNIKDPNNFFIGSPVESISMTNHDTGEYIKSVGDKGWAGLRTDKLEQGYLNKQYFQSWTSSESWLKSYLGRSMNARMATLQRILQGLIDTLGVGLTELATILDLLAMAIRKGINLAGVAMDNVTRFIKACANMFGMAVDISTAVLSKLLKKLMIEMAIVAKLALAKASKAIKSKEFSIIMGTTVAAGSLGVLLI